MKIAVPTNGDNLDSEINKSFGRAKRFLIIDFDTLAYDVVENTQNMQSSQGAGIQSANSAVKAGADALITMNCGPKAYRVLMESGVRVFAGIDGTIMKNIEKFKSNSLDAMTDANVEGHWV